MSNKSYSLLFFLFFTFLLRLEAFEALIDHRQGDGIGYKGQYSKIAVYHAIEKQSLQPFVDLRYLIFKDGKQGGNLGAGLGYQFPLQNRLSLYAYFDLRTSRTKYLFNQVTGGMSYTHPLRFYGKDWGEICCYLNGYFPLKSLEKNVSAPSFSRFRGHYLLLNEVNRSALTGGNLELGYLSNTRTDWNVYVAGSAYYFKRADLHAFGGYGKLRLIYKDLVYGECFVSGDRLFGTNVNGVIGIRIPLGKKGMREVRTRQYRPHKSRPIERLEPIVFKKSSREIIARDAFRVPLQFWFADNLSGSNGTFESPFPTLLQAQNISQNGDFIYVFPGDGTTNGMSAGFEMKPDQVLAGSGKPLTITTLEGTITIPALTSTDPTITNSAGSGVNLNTNCTVSGIVVIGAMNNGFEYPGASGSSTISLLNCIGNNNGNRGFDINSSNTEIVNAVFSNCSANNNGALSRW